MTYKLLTLIALVILIPVYMLIYSIRTFLAMLVIVKVLSSCSCRSYL